MLTTNLLPSAQKKEVKLEEIRRLVLFFATSAVTILILSSFLLLPSFLTFYFEEKELRRLLTLEEEAASHLGLKETIQNLNALKAQSNALKAYLLQPQVVSEILESLLEDAGPGMVFNDLSIKPGNSVSLQGTAPTRQVLLDFEKKLRESGRFQEVSIPLSNIIRETNINFTLQGKLNPLYRLKNKKELR